MKYPMIVPAVLTGNSGEFFKQATRLFTIFPYLQLDIADGKFVDSKTFEDLEELKNKDLKIPLELHLMVNDPVEEMRKWRNVENVFRVLFHAEATTDPLRSITFARKEGWDVGMVLNPDTDLVTLKEFTDRLDIVQFMTVYPGRQGAEFETKAVPKVLEFAGLKKRPLVAVDGGINKETIRNFRNSGVEIFCVGSAMAKSEDLGKTRDELLEALI